MKKFSKHLIVLGVLVACICIVFLLVKTTGTSNTDDKLEATQTSYYPKGDWRTSTPEAQGMDSKELNEMLKHILEDKTGIHSVHIIRNGYLVAESCVYPHKAGNLHLLNSCTKSVTSALIGMLINEGKIKSVEEKVINLFSDRKIANMDDKKKSMTLKNLLTMTTGLEWSEDGNYGASYDSNTQMKNSNDMVKYVLDKPMIADPGKVFYYNTGASHILSAIIKKYSNQKTIDYAREKLFTPMGVSDIVWAEDNKGINSGGSGLFLKPEDLAKFGYLYLNNGKWQDKQLIPESWVGESTMKQIDTPNGLAGQNGYGYQWWQNKTTGYSARGYAGQYLFVVPKYKLVVVFTSSVSGMDFYKPENFLDDYIIPSIKATNAIKENEQALGELQATISKLATAPIPVGIKKLPKIALEISGKKFVMDNDETYTFEFTEDSRECLLKQFSLGYDYNLKVGMDGIYRDNIQEGIYWKGFSNPVCYRGSWINENTISVDMVPLEDSGTYRMEFTFNGKNVNLKTYDATRNEISAEANGSYK
jgi:CubicO group peptidase (beta-lactamase class C family)